jgi:hypothetical protein
MSYEDEQHDSTRGHGPPAVHLGSLDPASEDESYWARFRIRIMTAAADELFRRRLTSETTVVRVMEGWSKALAPVAALAAALAGFFLYQEAPRAMGPLILEEALVAELEDQTLPLFIQDGEASDGAFQFASETF